MAYTGVDKKTALENLSARIQEDLSKAGLSDFYYKVVDVDDRGSAASTFTPKDATPDQCTRVEEIAIRHIRDFRKQRYRS
jgi:hypothetical protein